MRRRFNFSRCQTLRLNPELDDLLTEHAYNRSITKAAYIRSALIRQIKIDDEQFNRRSEHSNLYEPVLR